jgi:uncharacterized protein
MLTILLLVLGTIITFIFSTLSGGGASLLLMPIIAGTIGARGVAPIMTIGITFSSFSKVWMFWRHIDWHLFRWLFPSTIIGSVLGARLLVEVPVEWLQVMIALFLLSTVFQFKPKAVHRKVKAWHFAPMGFFVSFLSGLIGGVGPLMNAAFLNYGMSKEALLGTRSANAVLLHITKIISYGFLGLIDLRILKYGIIVGVAASFGTYLGKFLLGRISEKTFRYIVIVSMVLSGALMLVKNRAFILAQWHQLF